MTGGGRIRTGPDPLLSHHQNGSPAIDEHVKNVSIHPNLLSAKRDEVLAPFRPADFHVKGLGIRHIRLVGKDHPGAVLIKGNGFNLVRKQRLDFMQVLLRGHNLACFRGGTGTMPESEGENESNASESETESEGRLKAKGGMPLSAGLIVKGPPLP